MNLLWLACLALLPQDAKDLYAGWKQRGEIVAPAGRFVALPLGPRQLDACERPDLGDLRVVDARGGEVPRAIVVDAEVQEDIEQRATLLNRESPDQDTSRVTADFGTGVAKNRIRVVTDGSSFRRRVRIEGSDDGQSWAQLALGWLLAAGSEPAQRFETVELGTNTYRFLRLAVTRMPEESAPAILQVSCRHQVVRRPRETRIDGQLLAYTTEGQASTAEIDFGFRHLLLRRIELTLQTDPQRVFRRACQVWGRNTRTHVERIRYETSELGQSQTVETPWQPVGEGTVLRDAQGHESLALAIAARHRYLRLRIENGDSPPLVLGAVTGFETATYAVFEPAGQSSFVLYCGNSEAPEPAYESAAALAALEARSLPQCAVAKMEAQASALQRPPAASQTIVWALLATTTAVTALLLWLAARGCSPKPG